VLKPLTGGLTLIVHLDYTIQPLLKKIVSKKKLKYFLRKYRKVTLHANLISKVINYPTQTLPLLPYCSASKFKLCSKLASRVLPALLLPEFRLQKYGRLRFGDTFFVQQSHLRSFLWSLVQVRDLNNLRGNNLTRSLNYIKSTSLLHSKLVLQSDTFINYLGSFVLETYPWSFWKFHKTFFWKTSLRLASFYNLITIPLVFSLYRRFNKMTHNPHKPLFNLYWTFSSKQKFFINLRSNLSRGYNYISIYSGLFLRFFNNKKPLRSSKLFKALMVKLLRKILLASSVRLVNLIINRSAPIFSELYKLLLTPSIIPYTSPTSKGTYNDFILNKNGTLLFVKKIIFRRTHSFTTLKTPRRGRVKRKITRRLVRKNQVTD